jgi:hypothetical protein
VFRVQNEEVHHEGHEDHEIRSERVKRGVALALARGGV